MIKDCDAALFNFPKHKVQCRKLNVNGRSISNETALLKCWRDHFSLYAHFSFADQVLDVPLSIEEVECAVSKLKGGKSGGADGLLPEHITFGGPAINAWLLRIFNAIRDLENIPPSLVTIPVFKGKCRDPSNTNSYCGYHTFFYYRQMPGDCHSVSTLLSTGLTLCSSSHTDGRLWFIQFNH